MNTKHLNKKATHHPLHNWIKVLEINHPKINPKNLRGLKAHL